MSATRKTAMLFGVFVLAGCATPPALSPSELIARAVQYDGKEVRLHGWLIHKFEDVGIWDSQKAHDDHIYTTGPHPDQCVSYEGKDLGRNDAGRDLILQGRFKVTVPGPNEVIITNSGCDPRYNLKVESDVPP